jgi:hypothetical protein
LLRFDKFCLGLRQVFKQFSVFSNVGLIKFKHIKMNVYDSKIKPSYVLGLDRNGWVYVLFDCVIIGEAK